MTDLAFTPSSAALAPTSRLLFRPLESVASGSCHAEVYLPRKGIDPNADEPKGWPVVISIHGGGWTAGGCADVSLPQIEHLLGREIVCVSIEHRLAPHADLEVQISDCFAALEWIRNGDLEKGLRAEGKMSDTHPGINGTRIAALGYSSGGYLACMMALRAPSKLSAIMSVYGAHDLETLLVAPKEATFLGQTEEEKAFALQVWDEGVKTDDVAANRASPVNPRSAWLQTALISSSLVSHVLPSNLLSTAATRRLLSPLHLLSPGQPFPPTFLAIPELDTLCPPSQSWMLAERIKECGGEVVCRRADGAGHYFDRAEDARTESGGEWWEGVIRPGLDFLAEELGA